jgi:hypothetical protein
MSGVVRVGFIVAGVLMILVIFGALVLSAPKHCGGRGCIPQHRPAASTGATR